MADSIELERGAKIGNFNFVRVNRLVMKSNSRLGYLNRIKGNIDVCLDKGACLDHKIIASGPNFYFEGKKRSHLSLGEGSHILNGYLNLTDSISIGKNTTIAGSGSEFWTHSFYLGTELSRVDGEISIGDNCYIGSRCIFMPGVKVSNNIIVGAGSSVAKSLTEKGTYVNQSLRHLPTQADDAIKKFGSPIGHIGGCKIYKKNI